MKSTLDQITDIVVFYNEVGPDFADIDRLQTGVRKLATLIFMFAGEVGGLYKQKNRTEFARKAATEREKNRLIQEGKSVSGAETAAKELTEPLLNEEQAADSEYQAVKILYDSAGNVLKAMQQHVSNLKAEKSNEFRAGMVQQQ